MTDDAAASMRSALWSIAALSFVESIALICFTGLLAFILAWTPRRAAEAQQVGGQANTGAENCANAHLQIFCGLKRLAVSKLRYLKDISVRIAAFTSLSGCALGISCIVAAAGVSASTSETTPTVEDVTPLLASLVFATCALCELTGIWYQAAAALSAEQKSVRCRTKVPVAVYNVSFALLCIGSAAVLYFAGVLEGYRVIGAVYLGMLLLPFAYAGVRLLYAQCRVIQRIHRVKLGLELQCLKDAARGGIEPVRTHPLALLATLEQSEEGGTTDGLFKTDGRENTIFSLGRGPLPSVCYFSDTFSRSPTVPTLVTPFTPNSAQFTLVQPAARTASQEDVERCTGIVLTNDGVSFPQKAPPMSMDSLAITLPGAVDNELAISTVTKRGQCTDGPRGQTSPCTGADPQPCLHMSYKEFTFARTSRKYTFSLDPGVATVAVHDAVDPGEVPSVPLERIVVGSPSRGREDSRTSTTKIASFAEPLPGSPHPRTPVKICPRQITFVRRRLQLLTNLSSEAPGSPNGDYSTRSAAITAEALSGPITRASVRTHGSVDLTKRKSGSTEKIQEATDIAPQLALLSKHVSKLRNQQAIVAVLMFAIIAAVAAITVVVVRGPWLNAQSAISLLTAALLGRIGVLLLTVGLALSIVPTKERIRRVYKRYTRHRARRAQHGAGDLIYC